jgi:hypothetical protein
MAELCAKKSRKKRIAGLPCPLLLLAFYFVVSCFYYLFFISIIQLWNLATVIY